MSSHVWSQSYCGGVSNITTNNHLSAPASTLFLLYHHLRPIPCRVTFVMSTRSRVRSAPAANSSTTAATADRRLSLNHPEKRLARGKRKVQVGNAKSRRGSAGLNVYCTCRKPNDGTPMINCAVCDDWYVCHRRVHSPVILTPFSSTGTISIVSILPNKPLKKSVRALFLYLRS